MYLINSFVAIQLGKENTKHIYINTLMYLIYCASHLVPYEVTVQVKKFCLAACAQPWREAFAI